MIAPDEAEQFVLDLDQDTQEWLSLDKAWHGLHYLLTETAWEGEEPLCFLCQGGVELNWDDSFFEVQPRALTPNQVTNWSQAMALLDEDVLKARFEPTRMTELSIYPEIWKRSPADDDTLGYLLKHFRELQGFLSKAAVAGRGLLIATS